jgi:hypothetical protein
MTRHPVAMSAIVLIAMLGACKAASPTPDADVSAAAAPTSGERPASGIAAAAQALNPLATPKEAMLASMKAFREVRSYHASMRMDGGPEGPMTNEMDFVAPDRYRITMKARGMEVRNVRIGNDTWMTMNGRTSKVTMPPGTMDQWQDIMHKSQETMDVEAQGSETIDGVATRKYLIQQTDPQPSDVTVWINGDDLVHQARMQSDHQGATITTTIRYTRYNDPAIRIEPPQ